MGTPDDFHAGHYMATATVFSNRRNLFSMEPGQERHIATLVAGSRSQIDRFDADCDKIVRALAFYEAHVGSRGERTDESASVSGRIT